jgi:hypothetical protein
MHALVTTRRRLRKAAIMAVSAVACSVVVLRRRQSCRGREGWWEQGAGVGDQAHPSAQGSRPSRATPSSSSAKEM